MSPIKGKPGAKKYFDFTIQTENDVVRGVCFSPEKKNEIEHFTKSKSPVKIKRYSQNTKYGATNIVIEKNTQLSVTDDLLFKAADLDSGNTVASLTTICHNQTVTINAKLIKLYGSKRVPTNNLTKQEGLLTDNTGTIKVVFWESFVNMGEEGKSYEFTNFVYKDDRFGRYIGSAREGSSLVEIDDIKDALDPKVDEPDLAKKDAVMMIIGISSVQKYHSCTGCKKKIENFDETKVAVTCTACNLFQKTSKVSKQWVVKFLVQHKENSNRFQLTAFHAVVSQLMTTLGLPDDTKEDDLKLSLLDLEEFAPIYDSRNNTIIELL